MVSDLSGACTVVDIGPTLSLSLFKCFVWRALLGSVIERAEEVVDYTIKMIRKEMCAAATLWRLPSCLRASYWH
jgi:hypothetical protein